MKLPTILPFLILLALGTITNPLQGRELTAPTMEFDLDLFADLLEDQLDNGAVGWQFAIARGGQSREFRYGGQARTSGDSNPRAMMPGDRMGWASCSKPITAMAILASLEEHGLSPDSSIRPYLPTNWGVHPTVGDISFGDLLRHRSGLRKLSLGHDPGDRTEAQRRMMAAGVTESTGYAYGNHNYGMLRLTVAILNRGNAKFHQTEGWLDEALYEHEVARRLVELTQQHVIEPAGVTVTLEPVNFGEFQNQRILSYDFENPRQPGLSGGSYEGVGPGNWNMSARHMVKILAAWEHGRILRPQGIKFMKDNNAGIFETEIRGSVGYNHTGGAGEEEQGLSAVVYCFPGDIQVAAAVNSRNNRFGKLSEMVRAQYERTFEMQGAKPVTVVAEPEVGRIRANPEATSGRVPRRTNPQSAPRRANPQVPVRVVPGAVQPQPVRSNPAPLRKKPAVLKARQFAPVR